MAGHAQSPQLRRFQHDRDWSSASGPRYAFHVLLTILAYLPTSCHSEKNIYVTPNLRKRIHHSAREFLHASWSFLSLGCRSLHPDKSITGIRTGICTAANSNEISIQNPAYASACQNYAVEYRRILRTSPVTNAKPPAILKSRVAAVRLPCPVWTAEHFVSNQMVRRSSDGQRGSYVQYPAEMNSNAKINASSL